MQRAVAVPIAHRKRSRDLLVQALYQAQFTQPDAKQLGDEYRDENGKKVDWDFFNQALYFILTKPLEVDTLFLPHLDRDPSQLDPIETGILRMGVFELSQRLDVPYRVVINECVELAKKYGATDSHKFINGVLDKAAHNLRATEVAGASQ